MVMRESSETLVLDTVSESMLKPRDDSILAEGLAQFVEELVRVCVGEERTRPGRQRGGVGAIMQRCGGGEWRRRSTDPLILESTPDWLSTSTESMWRFFARLDVEAL